jgi:alpha-beta hydrolase superfamily lysophospholipase
MNLPFQIHIEPNRMIRGDVYPADQSSQGTLVICHGFKGFKDWGMFPYVAKQLSDHYDVITFNFSHNGIGDDLLEFTELEKFAANTYTRELEDLHTLIQHIRGGSLPTTYEIRNQPIFLLGHSKGAGVSLIYSFDYPDLIQGVISWNGIVNLDLFSVEEKHEMRSKGRAYVYNARTKQQMPLNLELLEDLQVRQANYHIIERVKSAITPIVLIQGTEDGVWLREGSAKLIEANAAIDWIQIPGGNHTFNSVHPFQGTTNPLEEAIRQTKKYMEDWTKFK